jgi:hypothetical protein
MAFDNYERYGVRVKRTAADVDDPNDLSGASMPILKDLLSEISVLRQDILQLKAEIADLHGAPLSAPQVSASPVDVAPPQERAPVTPLEEPERLPPEEPFSPEEPLPPTIESEAAPVPEEESSGGFFDQNLDTDSLVLSDDELQNILGSVEPPIEEPPMGESLIEEPPIETSPMETSPMEDFSLEESLFEEPPLKESPIDESILDQLSLEEPPLEASPLSEPPLPDPLLEELSPEESELEALSLDEPALDEPALEEPLVEEPSPLDPLEDIDLPVHTPEPILPTFEDDFAAAAEIPDLESPSVSPPPAGPLNQEIAPTLAKDIKAVLTYIDELLENLPEEKIVEFAKSDKYETYKKVFGELGIS